MIGWLLYGIVVFSPWALGSVPRWAVWTMNVGGYALAFLVFVRYLVEFRTRWSTPRWNRNEPRWFARTLWLLALGLLGWTLVSAVNAKSRFIPGENRLQNYPHYIAWLPHSYDGPSTWYSFWTYLGLAGVFWAARDWLSAVAEGEQPRPERDYRKPHLPRNLRTLLWVLSVNGAILALVSILQRLDGTPKRLWLFEGPGPEGQFGPFGYRGNAAQYFNLIWPLALGLWWVHIREFSRSVRPRAPFGSSPALLLPLVAAVMAACPFVAATRGGAMVALGLLGVGTLLWIGRVGPVRGWRGWGGFAVCLLGGLLGLAVGWNRLGPRLLEPDLATPIALTEPLRRFCLRLKMRIPPEPLVDFAYLASLSDDRRPSRSSSNAFNLWLNDRGALVAQQVGPISGEAIYYVLSGFLPKFADREVEITVVRDQGLQVSARSGEVVLQGASPRAAGLWDTPLAPRYLLHGHLPASPRLGGFGLSWVRLERRLSSAAEADEGSPTGSAGAGAGGPTRAELVAHVEVPLVSRRRFTLFDPESWSGRRELHEEIRIMARQLPGLLGAGPGTFSSVFQAHLATHPGHFETQAHNDWLQARVTFGLAFPALGIPLGVLLLIRPWLAGGTRVPARFIVWIWLPLVGCLIHARFDYPLQVHAVLLVILLYLASLSGLRVGSN